MHESEHRQESVMNLKLMPRLALGTLIGVGILAYYSGRISLEAAIMTELLMLMDLHDFKIINDSLGHAHGDGILQGAASRLRSCLSDSNTVTRLAGDPLASLSRASQVRQTAWL